MENIGDILNSYHSLSLADMENVSLMNRQDTKYVFSEDKLEAVLVKLKKDYKILQIDSQRLMSYSNIYFDTDDFMFYYKHHSGQLNRYKVRSRRYDNSNLAFCEIKFKTNKNRTQKSRQQILQFEDQYLEQEKIFLNQHLSILASQLKAKLNMRFDRMTLVHKNGKDRCTIDINLEATNQQKSFRFKGLVIAEIKQEKMNARSAFNLALKTQKIYPMSFSKYCISMAKVYPHLKSNRFKPKMILLDKILK